MLEGGGAKVTKEMIVLMDKIKDEAEDATGAGGVNFQ